jgi:hypothetical protein
MTMVNLFKVVFFYYWLLEWIVDVVVLYFNFLFLCSVITY